MAPWALDVTAFQDALVVQGAKLRRGTEDNGPAERSE